MIKQLQRKNIDDERWNSIIAASRHETVYPYTWYMDASADQWFGLVMGDYEYVMPVAFRKKYTIKYIYQPFHNQQLGVYSKKAVDNEIAQLFLKKIHRDFKAGDYAFNAGNILKKDTGLKITDRDNFVLPLNHTYEDLYKNYTGNARRNIRRSCKFALEISDKIKVQDFVEFKRANNRKSESKAFYQNMERLLLELEKTGKSKIHAVYLGGELCAATVFVFSAKRMIHMLAASNDEGRDNKSMFFLVDSFIKSHAGEDVMLDFEGSTISSVASFFADFGAKAEIYQRVGYNRLPIKKTKGKKNV